MPWFAIRVKPNFEKTAATSLSGKGLEPFLPTYKQARQWSDRVRVTEFPLFPGYLFCRFEPKQPGLVLLTPGVIDIVSYGREYVPVSDDEIAAVRRVVREGIPAEPAAFLQHGHFVRVIKGALKGITGLIIETKGNYRLVLQVSLLQRSLSVHIDRDCVVPVLLNEGQATPDTIRA